MPRDAFTGTSFTIPQFHWPLRVKLVQTCTVEVPAYFNFAVDVMDRWAAERPKAPGLWCVDAVSGAEARYTFRQLSVMSCQAANLLASSGVEPGDRVLLMLPRMPQWWIAMLGLIRLGAVPVPCTPLLTTRDLEYRVQCASIRAAITDAGGVAKLSSFDGLRFMTGGATPGWIDFDHGMKRAAAEYQGKRTRSDGPAIIYFTSATTGEPKMVLHTQASYGLAHKLTGQLWLDLTPDDLHWNLSDVGWAKAAWSSFYGPWSQGACVFGLETHGRFDPALTLKTLSHYPITTWCAPPTALRLIVKEDLSAWRFPHLRHCVSAGEPVNPEVIALWKAATGLTIHEAYGQTETVVLVGNFRSLGHPVRPGSMGKATPGFDLAILDDDLNELPPGQEGEIAIRIAPKRPVGLFKEYWRNPKENSAQFRGDWYLTGDRAIRDAEGYFWFVGRKDDVIKSSGYRIGPSEVEHALLEHVSVVDAAVVGKPDPVRGQIVKAFVMLRQGVEPSETLKRELQHHCKQVVAPYKYPRELEFVAALPKTNSGKTRRVELRQRG